MKHILLIEDDPAIADPLSYALTREQWRVTWHDTGIAALAALQAQPTASSCAAASANNGRRRSSS